MPDQSAPTPRIRKAREPSRGTAIVTTTAAAIQTTVETEEDPRLAAFQTRVMGQVTHEIRTLEKHVSEVTGTVLASYSVVTESLASLNTKIDDLAAKRDGDAAFIEKQKEDAARKAAELTETTRLAELEAVRATTRQEVIAEQEAKAARLAESLSQAHVRAVERANRILYVIFGASISGAFGLAGYLITGIGKQTGTSIAITGGGISLLAVMALTCAWLIR